MGLRARSIDSVGRRYLDLGLYRSRNRARFESPRRQTGRRGGGGSKSHLGEPVGLFQSESLALLAYRLPFVRYIVRQPMEGYINSGLMKHLVKQKLGKWGQAMASLYVIRGRDVGKRFELNKPRVELGRDSDNDMQLHDTEVSRHHAAILCHQDRFELSDLESSNGTFLNSVRVSHKRLQNGDRIQIGKTLMIFSANANQEGNPANASNVDIVRVNQVQEMTQIRRSLASDRPGIQDTVAGNVGRDGAELSQAERSGIGESTQREVGARERAATPAAHWELVYRTALAVSRTLDIDSLLKQILDLIFQWIDCDRGCIMLFDEETNNLQPSCRRNRSPEKAMDRMEISKTILDYVIERSEGVYTSNAREDGRWDAGASIVSMGIREAICVPMQGRYGIVGAIYIDTSYSHGKLVERGSKACFTEDHLKLMIAIGNQAALAIEDTFYYRGMVQSERLATMGQTIATVSHHIKNILQGVQSGSYLVQEGLKSQQWESVARGWKIVHRNQERIEALVLDMLTYSKERTPHLRRSDPRLLVDELVENVSLRAKDLGVTMVWERPREFPMVEMDGDAMNRALLNVIMNGLDAVEGVSQPRLAIRMHLEDEAKISILVEDNGVGIAEEHLSRFLWPLNPIKGPKGQAWVCPSVKRS